MMGKPKIRFKGYNEDWEQRKLGEIATYRNGKAHEANQLDVGTYELVNLNSISIDGGLKPSGKFIEDGSDTLQRNDLVMVLSDVGHGDLLGRVAIIPENNRYVLNQRVALLRINDDTNTYFLFSIINRYQDYFKKLGAGSSQLNISRGIVENFEVAYPNVAEQRMIADYFQSLDHLITLHQHKCDEMKKLKKCMLQKMFPQNGKKVPEIRFEGFTNDWEQRKFSELYAKSSEKNDGSIGMDKNITVATMQFKEDVKVSTAEYLKTYYTFNLGDIAFEGHQSKEFRYGRFVENDIGNGIVSHIFAVFRPIREYDLYFWKYAINNETLMQRILSRSTKASTMMHDLVTKDFLNEMFLVPSFDEQRQIGVFLDTLDHLITLHQHKCDELQNLKKYMLQNMFV